MSVSGTPIRRIPFASSVCSAILLAVLIGCGPEKADQSPPVLIAGTVEWGTEGGMFFRSCGSDVLTAMYDPGNHLDGVHSFASVFATQSDEGWIVTGVNYVPVEGFDCVFDWDGTLWRAAGNEPFWSASLEEDGLSVRTPSKIRTSSVMVDGLSFISVRDSLELHLTPGVCQDTMADTRYGFTARMVMDGRTMSGCAFKGMAEQPIKP